MPTTFRPYHPDQILLLAPDHREWVPEGHLSHQVSDLVDSHWIWGRSTRRMKVMGVATRLISHR